MTHDPNFVKVYNNTMLNWEASGGSGSGTGALNFEYLSGTLNFKNNLIYQGTVLSGGCPHCAR